MFKRAVLFFFVFFGLTFSLLRAAENTDETAVPEAGAVKTLTVHGIEYRFHWCPPGTFMMGSPESEKDRRPDETEHQVTLTKGFWILETQVTQKMWQDIMLNNPSIYKNPEAPIEGISWYDAVAFCEKLRSLTKKRITLPTEAEWEYACRAGSAGMYSGTGNLNDMGWYKENSNGKTNPVAQKTPNAWGLYDVHGNVGEWCSDLYGKYPAEAVIDPKGPREGEHRVVRGGDWFHPGDICRSACRSVWDPNERNSAISVRCVMR